MSQPSLWVLTAAISCTAAISGNAATFGAVVTSNATVAVWALLVISGALRYILPVLQFVQNSAMPTL